MIDPSGESSPLFWWPSSPCWNVTPWFASWLSSFYAWSIKSLSPVCFLCARELTTSIVCPALPSSSSPAEFTLLVWGGCRCWFIHWYRQNSEPGCWLSWHGRPYWLLHRHLFFGSELILNILLYSGGIVDFREFCIWNKMVNTSHQTKMTWEYAQTVTEMGRDDLTPWGTVAGEW